MKTLLISHIADLDGISPIILLNLTGIDFEFQLLEIYETTDFFSTFIETKAYDNYTQIYVTDLGLSKEVCEMINGNEELKSKLLIFDHHQGNLFVNEYPFATVVVRNEAGRMECGTSLFYQYLKKKFPNSALSTSIVATYVEYVREGDTWDFLKEHEKEVWKLGQLAATYTRDRMIQTFTERLKENVEQLISEQEQYLLEIEDAKMWNYIEKKKKEIFFATLNGIPVGIVFAENYRSQLGNHFAELFQDKIDYMIVINLARSISYRTKKEINVAEVAKLYGGSGHQKAAGSPFPKGFRESLIEQLYKGIVLEEQDGN